MDKLLKENSGLAVDLFEQNMIIEPLTDWGVGTGYLNDTGGVTASANWRTTPFIKAWEGKKFYYRGVTAASSKAVCCYDASQALLSIELAWPTDNSIEHTIVCPVGTAWIRACARMTAGDIFVFNQEILKGTGYTFFGDVIQNTKLSWAAVGDSITSEDGGVYPVNAGDFAGLAIEGYQTLIQKVLKFSKYTEYGYSGASLVPKTGDNGNNIVNKLSSFAAHDLFTLYIGTNDFKKDQPIGELADYDSNTGSGTFYGALRLFVNRVYELNAKAKVIIVSPTHRDNGGYNSGTTVNGAGKMLRDYVKALKTVAEAEAFPFVNLFKRSGINLKNRAQYLYDGLHPNGLGYRLIANTILREMYFHVFKQVA